MAASHQEVYNGRRASAGKVPSLCVEICPKTVLELSREVNTKGYFPVFRARPEDCIYCAMCCVMCPDVAITITEDADSSAA